MVAYISYLHQKSQKLKTSDNYSIQANIIDQELESIESFLPIIGTALYKEKSNTINHETIKA